MLSSKQIDGIRRSVQEKVWDEHEYEATKEFCGICQSSIGQFYLKTNASGIEREAIKLICEEVGKLQQ